MMYWKKLAAGYLLKEDTNARHCLPVFCGGLKIPVQLTSNRLQLGDLLVRSNGRHRLRINSDHLSEQHARRLYLSLLVEDQVWSLRLRLGRVGTPRHELRAHAAGL